MCTMSFLLNETKMNKIVHSAALWVCDHNLWPFFLGPHHWWLGGLNLFEVEENGGNCTSHGGGAAQLSAFTNPVASRPHIASQHLNYYYYVLFWTVIPLYTNTYTYPFLAVYLCVYFVRKNKRLFIVEDAAEETLNLEVLTASKA